MCNSIFLHCANMSPSPNRNTCTCEEWLDFYFNRNCGPKLLSHTQHKVGKWNGRTNNQYNRTNNQYNCTNNQYNRPNNQYNHTNNQYNQTNNQYNHTNNRYSQDSRFKRFFRLDLGAGFIPKRCYSIDYLIHRFCIVCILKTINPSVFSGRLERLKYY